MFENWFLECDEDMQTTGLHATGCVMIAILQISQLVLDMKYTQNICSCHKIKKRANLIDIQIGKWC